MYRLLFDQVFRRMDPELAHRLGFRVIRGVAAAPGLGAVVHRLCTGGAPRRLRRRRTGASDAPSVPVRVLGRDLPGRFGLAAGFDKDARGIRGLTMLGFSFVEVGTVTAHPQPGNDPPRLWRVPEQRGLRNRMGFNNDGAQAVAERLRRARATSWGRAAVVGVNLGKSKVTPADDAASDYAAGARLLAPYADYLVVNVSSPNTPGLRLLQSVDQLRPILRAVRDGADEVTGPTSRVPLLVKIAPDLSDEELDALADLVTELDLDGMVAVNTTVRHGLGEGGLSGPVLLPRGLAVVSRLRERLGAGRVLIGVGGISTADDAQAYLDAGADLVQAYTGFVYQGPAWPGRVARGLAARAQATHRGGVR